MLSYGSYHFRGSNSQFKKKMLMLTFLGGWGDENICIALATN